MTILLLVWLSSLGLPAAGPVAALQGTGANDTDTLRLDIRIFDATNEVTGDTIVSLYDAGSRAGARRVPLASNGERQLQLPAGQYDLQLLHQDDGRVLRVRWTTLRLLVAYPGAHGQHLEVLNMRQGFGALQVRRATAAAELGSVPWAATLRPAGGGEPVASPVRGDGYVLFVAPPGRYDVEIRTREGETRWIRDADIREDLTYLKSWGG